MASKATKVEKEEAVEAQATYLSQQFMLRVLWVLLFVGLSALIYSQMTRDDVLPIQQIKVSGEFDQLESQDFQPILTNGLNGNFFTINVSDIYQQLITLPWVEKVWIHRIWPNTIKVNFQEQKPIAILKGKGLLNQSGIVFTQEITSFNEKLPKFVVAKNYISESIKQFELNNKILKENDLEARVFYYDERKSQKIKLSNGIELILGRFDVEERLIKFVKAYKMQLQNETQKILKVDLRYTNGLAIAWRQAAAKSQPLLLKQLA